MPYREDQARRNSRGDAQSSAERRLASAKTEAWVLLTQQQRGAVSAEELRRFDGLPLPGVSSHGADSGHAPLPTRRAAMGYNVAMDALELPSSPVVRSPFHPHSHAVVLQPTRALQPAGDAPAAHAGATGGGRVGDVCGVGMSLADRPPLSRRGGAEGRVVILDIKPRSPAAFCGRLAVNDEILAVDEQSTAGMSAAAVSQLVRGAEGSVLRLSLRKCTDGCFAEVFLMRCVITSRYGESEDVVMVHLCAASERGLR